MQVYSLSSSIPSSPRASRSKFSRYVCWAFWKHPKHHFTRYAEAIPCKLTSATGTAKALFDNFIVNFSFPEQLHSDQGRNFDCRLIQELYKLPKPGLLLTIHLEMAVVNVLIAPYLRCWGTLEENQNTDWKSYISPLFQAYNATKNDATWYSPHFQMHGWHPLLTVDRYLGTNSYTDGNDDPSSNVAKLRDRMDYGFKVACANATDRAKVNNPFNSSICMSNYAQTCLDMYFLTGNVINHIPIVNLIQFYRRKTWKQEFCMSMKTWESDGACIITNCCSFKASNNKKKQL